MAAALPGALPGLSGVMTANKYCNKPIQKAGSPGLLFVYFLMIFFSFSCNNNQRKDTQKTSSTDAATVYYPINAYIRRQIKDVDTIPYFLYRLSSINGKKDSSVIDRATFDAETKPFLLPGLEDKAFRANFTESVFDDESTGSITLTYSPKNKTGIVQNASVLLDKDNQQVKWIFINTLSSNGDSTLIQRIGWKGGKSCYINEDVSYPDKPETQRQLSFVWNDKAEE